ncbi:hypothetical protein [Chondromyces apiculatus]|uniref:Uncharacterized protein n=1 Tax=Chondromyces apiculatus DSM 436 TaxID=1192034 RepID=A0A017SYR1_9BACT|nr:hypothetical protein [Chondromyces apiculatus]EYF01917.1 Hypothetical protein CAP_7685 [Chondromyces apiculatus DSM 436]
MDKKNAQSNESVKETKQDEPEVRKVVIKTAIRAGQGSNRYAAT